MTKTTAPAAAVPAESCSEDEDAVTEPVEVAEPLGTREARTQETVRLFTAAAAASDPAFRDAIHEQIVRLNMPVARQAAHRYRNRGIDDDDLEQVAYTALVMAVRRFDAEVGQDFLNFAMPTIHGSLKRHFRDQGWAVRPPRRIQDLQQQVSGAREHLMQRYGRSPRPTELAAHLHVSVDDVIESLTAYGCYSPASLDQPLGTPDTASGDTVGDLLATLDREQDVVEARVMLRPLVEQLSDRDRRIVAARFFEQRTQQEIADELGVSQMQVSRLLARILRDLHRMLVGDGAGGAAMARQRCHRERRPQPLSGQRRRAPVTH